MSSRFLDRFKREPRSGAPAPSRGTRAEAIHRLQIGITGLALMIMLVMLADAIRDRADQTDAATVAEATVKTEQAAPRGEAAQSNPLVEAGVVPDLPSEPKPLPNPSPAAAPAQGTGGAAQ